MSKVVTFAGSKFIPLEALNVGYSASTTSQPTDQDEPVGPAQAGGVSGFQPVAEGENSNDAFSVAPETPQRAPEPNPGNCHTIKSCTYMYCKCINAPFVIHVCIVRQQILTSVHVHVCTVHCYMWYHC